MILSLKYVEAIFHIQQRESFVIGVATILDSFPFKKTVRKLSSIICIYLPKPSLMVSNSQRKVTFFLKIVSIHKIETLL